MSEWCCSAINHPADYICREVVFRAQCTVKPDGTVVSGTGTGGGGGVQYEMPKSLVDLEQALGEDPTPLELLALMQELQTARFDVDVDRIADFLETKLPNTDYALLSNVYRIRSASLVNRGEPYRALDALEIAHELERVALRREVMMGQVRGR